MNPERFDSLKETPSRFEVWDAILEEAAPETMAEIGV